MTCKRHASYLLRTKSRTQVVIPVLSAGNTDEQLERVWVDLQDCLNSSAAALLLMLAEGGNSARVPASQPQWQGGEVSPYVGQLIADPAFANAVKTGDLRSAAWASWVFFQSSIAQFIKDLNDQHAAAYGGLPYRARENIQVGDWMVISSSNRSTDPELLGQQGRVLSLEHNGWVELLVPKLGRTVKLQQRYLSHATSSAHPGRLRSLSSLGGPAELAGAPAYHTGSMRRASLPVYGEGSPEDDGVPPPRRSHHFEGYVRPPTLGMPLPPARVPQLLGRGVTKAREVARTVRREVLSLEEVVPWECVVEGWRARRPAWRKGLRSLEAVAKAVESHIPQVAASLLELHEALLTDKSPAGGRGGGGGYEQGGNVLARGGPWEARLRELAAGGNNYACLQAVWDEMHEAVRVWLHAQGQALPPPGSSSQGTGHGLQTRVSGGYEASLPQYGSGAAGPLGNHHLLHDTNNMLGLAGSAAPGLERGAYAAALRAFLALEAGAASGHHMLSQVAVDRILGLGRDAYAGLKALLAREEAHVTAALEGLAASADLGALLGLSPEDVARLSDADVVSLLLASPALRAELQLVRGVDSEPDTEEEEEAGGPEGEATDMEDD